MDSQATPQQQANIGDVLPWVKMTLDYTEQLAALVPEDKLEWRPEDPSGGFFFSLGEIVMHCADARRMFAGQLHGTDTADSYWSPGPGEGSVWEFKKCADKQALLASLAETRRLLQDWLDRPASELLDTTAGTRQAYERMLQWHKEHGKDTNALAKAGPANIMRVLMATAIHEAGHRGSLQTLLRLHGVNVGQEG